MNPNSEKVLLGALGPIRGDVTYDRVLLNEAAFFDRTKPGLNPTRLSLENRWEFLQKPYLFLDNLSGSIELLEHELKHIEKGTRQLICLHSNDILLSGDKTVAERLETLFNKYANVATVVLAIGLPRSHAFSQESAVEYLASHIFYGKNGLLFGMLGPLVIDSTVTTETLNMYAEAHKKTGAPLLLHVVNFTDSNRICHAGVNPACTIFFGAKSEKDLETIHCCFGSGTTCPIIGLNTNDLSEREIDALLHASAKHSNISLTTSAGCQYKTDFKKCGGSGFFVPISISPNYIAERLAFPWSAPVLESRREEESDRWVCDVCGVTARLNEKENYTKLGFTYCSIACLASHRKRGFCPL